MKSRQAAHSSTAAATGFQADELAQRLLQLGMRQQQSPGILNDDSSSEDEQADISNSSRSRRYSDWQRWQGPLPLLGSSVGGDVSQVSRVRQRLQQLRQQQDGQQQDSFSFSSAEPTGRSSRRNSANTSGAAGTASSSAAAAGDEDDLEFFALDAQSAGSRPELSGGSDNTLMRSRRAAGDADGEQLVAPSPRIGAARRRGPPPRTPSRIILSPVAPDGSDKLFVAIPKQPVSEKRRKPVMRSATVSAAATPSSAGRQSVLAALLGSQGNLGKSTAHSPKAAAAAAAAAGMPYNVAVAAAQLLGGSGSTRDAAAAAIAAAVANEQQQYPPTTPHRPVGFAASAPCSADSSAEALRSPIAATPRGGQLPLTPPTPVHPAVVAAAAAAIAAAAEAAGEEAAAAAAATAAAAREREALAVTGVSCTIAEEGEDNSSVVDSVGADADAEDNVLEADEASDETGSSCSEEWWCGELTGLTVRDIMTGPLQVVSADADVSVARQLMVQHNLPGILVDVGPSAEPGFLTRR
jgi:CBS domain-containing protein